MSFFYKPNRKAKCVIKTTETITYIKSDFNRIISKRPKFVTS